MVARPGTEFLRSSQLKKFGRARLSTGFCGKKKRKEKKKMTDFRRRKAFVKFAKFCQRFGYFTFKHVK